MTDEEARSTMKPHFVLETAKLEKLRARITDLKLGDSRTTATASIGAPDHEELLAPKQEREWKCRNLVYYVSLIEELPGNVNDKKVELVFDRQTDRLVAILSNVEGVSNRGDLSQCR